MLLVTDVPKAESRSSIPLCGSKDDCDGIWCVVGRVGQCNMWTCNITEDCMKIVRCHGLPGPSCMEGICSC